MPPRSSRFVPAACRSTSPGLEDLVTRNLERLHFELEVGPLMEHARLLFVCVDTPPTYSGDADLSRVEAVIEELPASSEHAIVMKSTVPVGTGANVARRLGELGKGELGYASNPEFLKEGSAVVDFMQPDRVVVGADERTPWAAAEVARLYEPLDCPMMRDRRRLGGDDQARLERVPGDEDLVHQRDRQRVRGGRRGRGRGRGRHGPRPPHRRQLPERGRGLRGFLFPQGRVRPETARRQLRATTSSS